MKKTILSMLFLLAGIGCFAQKSGIIIGVDGRTFGKIFGVFLLLEYGNSEWNYLSRNPMDTRNRLQFWLPVWLQTFQSLLDGCFHIGKSCSGKSRVF